MNYLDMDPDSQNLIQQEVNQRAIEIKSIFRNMILSIGKLLILLNLVGAISVILYNNMLNGPAVDGYLKISLFSFAFGIVTITMALMFLFMRAMKVESSYAVDRTLFFSNQLSFGELKKNDGERCDSDSLEFILVLFSFIAFISGVLYGVFNFV